MYLESTFRDATDQEASLPGWKQEYRQVSAGGYEGRTSVILLPGVEILRETISVGTEQFFSAPEDSVVFYYYPRQDKSDLARGDAGTGPCGFALNWINRIGFMDADSDLLMLVLKREAIAHAGAEDFTPFLEPPGEQAVFLADWLLCLLSSAGKLGISYDDNAVLADLIHDRFELLFTRSAHREPSRIDDEERVYGRIRARLLETPNAPHTVRSLSRDLDLPAPKLRASCQAVSHMPLDKLLTLLRLNGARRDLIEARGTARKVSDIAMDWGFFHWSRFALRYRALFGEAPSWTLKS